MAEAPPLAVPSADVEVPVALVTSPYKGLVPYSEDDAQFFFGRERDRRRITSNLKASRVTLLYGASGVGKSSVLRAGVIHHLREQAKKSLHLHGDPDFLVVEFSSWRDDDPMPGLEAAIWKSVDRLYGMGATPPVPTSRSLSELIRGWNARLDVDLLFVFDQFEEYFLYHGRDQGEGTFDFELPRAVGNLDLRAGFLIAIREDAYTQLDQFKSRIPNLFGNSLRIEHLDREAARSAIVKPIAQFNKLLGPEVEGVRIEDDLVERVLHDLRSGQVSLGHAGKGFVAGQDASSADRIEAPYMQLVLSRLWDEEMRLGSRVLRTATLEQLGGASVIVRTHLDGAMSAMSPAERDIAARVFDHLVTPGGNKIAHTLGDLAHYSGVPKDRLLPVVERLAAGDIRILRAVPAPSGDPQDARYEIFHDVLADPILDWHTRYEAEGEGLVKPPSYWVVTIPALLLFFLIGGFAIYFSFQVNRRWKTGNFPGAKEASRRALILGVTACCIEGLYGLYVGFGGLFAS